MKPNNVTRMLDQRKIAYEAFELPVEKLGALEVAIILKVPPHLVYKTIVVLRGNQGKQILAVIPGDREVDLKALASAVGEKKVFLATEKQAEQYTGLQVGGISPLALIKRAFQVVIDTQAQSLDTMYVSGGQRGLNIRMAPSDLANLTKARFASITR
ncbi:MAG: aminoacyl-tRNA deacylase [Anaerolineales bacterium]